MIFLLSPAKSLNYTDADINASDHQPRFPKETQSLVNNLKRKSSKKIMELMSVSKNIADLNVQRYKEFDPEYPESLSKSALMAFAGDVYTGLDATSLNADGLQYCNKHLRILSGLYGLLRPDDMMQAYRLEMGTRLKIGRNTNLYQFWKDKITDLLNEDLELGEHKTVVNLASNEYFKAVNTKKLNGNLITINFKEERDGKLKFISFNAKKARGLMVRFAAEHKITEVENLKGFDTDGYFFSQEDSTETDWLFIR